VNSGRSLLRRWRWLDLLLTFAILGLIGAIVLRLDAIESVAMLGVPQVIDGDSLVLNGERIRLQGIDAPELQQTCERPGRSYDCGRESRAKLRELIGGKKVNCLGWQRDKYQRLLSKCSTGLRELNSGMVASGWAIAYGDYSVEEASARSAKIGLWEGNFDTPQDWRRIKGALAETPHDIWLTIRGYLSELIGIWKG
jgi:endonuclease YncB( thermonuclease family)